MVTQGLLYFQYHFDLFENGVPMFEDHFGPSQNSSPGAIHLRSTISDVLFMVVASVLEPSGPIGCITIAAT